MPPKIGIVCVSTLLFAFASPCTANGGAPVYTGAGTGTHYWIDQAKGSDTNPGTQALPWKRMDKLESVTLAPGDLVHVMPGLYDLSYNLQLVGHRGRADAWIGIQAEGAVTVRNSEDDNVINVTDCHYLFLKGFEITHDNRGLPYGNWDTVDGVKFHSANSDHISIDSCRIHDLGNVGVSSQAPEVQYLTVYNSEIYNCFVGIYWGYYEATVKRYAHYGRIANNYIHDCPPVDLDGNGYGIQIKGGSRGNVIEDNVLVNVAGNLLAAIAVYHISTNLATYAEQNVIRRNFIRASRNEAIFAVEGATIENNIVIDSQAYGINVAPRDTGAWGRFYGNLTIRNNTSFRVAAANGHALSIQDGSFAPPLIVANNLLMVTGGPGQLAMRGPSAFTGTGVKNFCYGGTSGSNLGVVSLSALSVVQSTTYGTANFLHPSPGSTIVDGASTAYAAATDFNDRLRGAVADAGAYELLEATNTGWTLSDAFKRISDRSDLLWQNRATGDVVLFVMNGSGISSVNAVTRIADTKWQIIGTGDYNGDTKPDILWRHETTGSVFMFLMNGATVASAGAVGSVPDTNWQVRGSGDYNGDGRSDIVWHHRTTGDVVLFFMNGTSIASVSPVTRIPDTNWQIKGTGDYNGDRKADILWHHQTTGDTFMFLMNGATIASAGAVGSIPDTNWQVRGSGDYNGDGKSDIIWHHRTTGDVVLFLMNGTSITSVTGVTRITDTNWQIRATGDYNGDTKADVLWHDQLRGNVFMFLMNGATISSAGAVGAIPDTNWQIVP